MMFVNNACMDTPLTRIENWLHKNEKSWADLARALGGYSEQRLQNWKKRGIPMGEYPKLSAATGLSIDYIATGRGAAHTNALPGPDIRGHVPLISWVQAGAWNHAEDPLQPGESDHWLPCPASHGRRTYALRVRGDSMTAPHGKSYPDGCIIFVDPDQKSPANGARIIAKLAGRDEVTFKTLVIDAGRTWLKPLNPQHPPLLDEFRVLGTVIGKWEEE